MYWIKFIFLLILVGCSNTNNNILSLESKKTMVTNNFNIKKNNLNIGKPFLPLGHSRPVMAIAFSPNGKYLVSGSEDYNIKLWDTKNRKLLKTFRGHSSKIISIAFSPDGKYLLSGSWDDIVKLWDTETGTELRTFKGDSFSKYVSYVAFSPNGKYIISKHSTDRLDDKIKIWNIQNGKELKKIFKEYSKGSDYISFSSNDKYIACGNSTNKNISLWNINKGKKLKTFKGHSQGILSLAISPNGEYLVSGSGDKTIKIWDIKGGQELNTLKNDTWVTSITISPNSKYIASGGKKSIIIWDIKNGKKLKKLTEHISWIFDIVFSRSGKYILSKSADIILWNLYKGNKKKKFSGNIISRNIGMAAFSPNEQNIAFGNLRNQNIKFLDIENNKESKFFQSKTNAINSVSISNSGRFIASVSDHNNTIKLWDNEIHIKLKTLKGHKYGLNTIVFSPNEKYIASGGWDDTIKLWNVKSGNLIKTFKGHKESVNSVIFSPDNKYIISASDDHSIRVWNIKDGKESKVFDDNPFDESNSIGYSFQTQIIHSKAIKSVAISSNGKYIVSADYNHILKLWDFESEKKLQTFTGHTNGIDSVIFSPNDKYIASGSRDSTIKLWSVKTGKELKTFKGHKNRIQTIVFTSNGKYIISGSDDKTIKLWSVETGKELKTFKGHDAKVNSIKITSDNKYLVSGSSDGTIKLWDINTGEEILTYVTLADNEWVIITPDGYFDASKNGAKYLNIRTSPTTISTIDNYYEKFYRPDIIQLALHGKKINKKIKLKNIKPAPEVEIANISKIDSTNKAKITLNIKDMGGSIGDIRIYINDTAIKLDNSNDLKKINSNTFSKTYTLKLQEGVNKIKVTAFEKTNSARSNYATTNIKNHINIPYKPNIHAIIIGINEYRNPDFNLKYAESDAKLFEKTIRERGKGLFNEFNIEVLTEKKDTTKTSIINHLNKLKDLNPNDLFIFFVASHGLIDNGDYYLITANVGSTSTRKIKEDALTERELKILISNIPTTKKLIFLDTCSSEKLGNSLQKSLLSRGINEARAIKILSRAIGSTILSATKSTAQALEGYKGHGIFTYTVVKGLNGKADSNSDGFIKTLELADYVEDEVPLLSQKVFNKEQFPITNISGQSFPIGKVIN